MTNNKQIGTETEINIRKDMVQLALIHFKEKDNPIELADQFTNFVLYGYVPSGTIKEEMPNFTTDTVFVVKEDRFSKTLPNFKMFTKGDKYKFHTDEVYGCYLHDSKENLIFMDYDKNSVNYWGNFFTIEQP